MKASCAEIMKSPRKIYLLSEVFIDFPHRITRLNEGNLLLRLAACENERLKIHCFADATFYLINYLSSNCQLACLLELR